jgi:ribosome biogenesis SPOUT family RNA methylase Rps3
LVIDYFVEDITQWLIKELDKIVNDFCSEWGEKFIFSLSDFQGGDILKDLEVDL